MLTDWLIVRRLAAELNRELRGARIRSVGRMPDGRFGLRVPRGTLAVDAFGPTPIVTLDAGEAPLEHSAGWVRTMADALEGLRVESVRSRRGDRLLAFECSSRSRFGVQSGYRLVAELVPRFGNVLLLKDDTVVSAAKEFTRSDNARRSTQTGESYQPPPLPQLTDDGQTLAAAFTALARTSDEAALARAVRSLRIAVPLLPRLVAESLIAEAALLASAAPRALAERCLGQAQALLESTAGEPAGLGDVFAYRDGASLVQCHVVPLHQYAALQLERVPSLLPLLAEVVGGATLARATQAFEARRAALRARIDKRRTALAAERRALERERDDASARDALRRAGELLYAHASEVRPGAKLFIPPSEPTLTIALDPSLDAKANAAAIFKRYRKAVAKIEHAAGRLEELERDAQFASELAWELERAEPETLEDVAESVERLERRKAAAPKVRAAKRRPLDVRVASDARVYVGRSPVGNADLTFRIARPEDLWFHARATPGAHVVLHIDSPRSPTQNELLTAASLAAYHSKARGSEKVPVDYTERKHVRRQASAAPGLVWYTHARTLLVSPREPAPAKDPA